MKILLDTFLNTRVILNEMYQLALLTFSLTFTLITLVQILYFSYNCQNGQNGQFSVEILLDTSLNTRVILNKMYQLALSTFFFNFHFNYFSANIL